MKGTVQHLKDRFSTAFERKEVPYGDANENRLGAGRRRYARALYRGRVGCFFGGDIVRRGEEA